MLRPCTPSDFDSILRVINDAAEAYRGVIPDDRWHEPYMPPTELRDELDAGVAFTGAFEGHELVGVMGLQDVLDVTLVRHAYVRSDRQGRGLGGRLLAHLLDGLERPVLVGTWRAATWAVRFYERHGFRVLSADDCVRVLRKYWSIPDRQVDESVVLANSRWFDLHEVPCQFSDVDRASDPDALTAYLDGVAGLDTVHAYKTAALHVLDPGPGNRVLDLGCGVGTDVPDLARAVGPSGTVLAVDFSRAMVARTLRDTRTEPTVRGVVADARRLPFVSDCFDRCRTDKVLQHVHDPELAVREIVRVTRPGGGIVIAEPDWNTFQTEPSDAVGRALPGYAHDSIASGGVGSRLEDMLASAGARDVTIREHVLEADGLVEADRLFRVRDFVEGAAREGRVAAADGHAWIERARRWSDQGLFRASLTIFLVSGVA
jgi:SAM-dependent methyltransferase